MICAGANTFFGRAASLVGQDDDSTGHLQKILAQIASFCLVSIGIFVVTEIFVLYAGFRYEYRRRGLNNILVLLIRGIPIAIPTVLSSITLAVGAQRLAKHKAIVTRITAIEELAGVTILYSDKTGTLTTNKLTIDRQTIRTYGPFSADDVILLAAYASHTENQDAIDSSVVGALGDTTQAHAGIKLLDFKPFNPVDKCTEITYREELENTLEADIEEFTSRGLRALAVAYVELEGDDPEADGNGFELIGLLAIFNPRVTIPNKQLTMQWLSVSRSIWLPMTNLLLPRKSDVVSASVTMCTQPRCSRNATYCALAYALPNDDGLQVSATR